MLHGEVLSDQLTRWCCIDRLSSQRLPEKWSSGTGSAIAHIGTHSAYHTGQIIYIRRLQGSWDPSKCVS